MSDNLTVRELRQLLEGMRDDDEVLVVFILGHEEAVLGTVSEECRVRHANGAQLMLATDGEYDPFWTEDPVHLHLVRREPK